MASHMQVSTWYGKENAFIEGKRKAIWTKSPCLFIGWVLARREEESFFFCWAPLSSQGVRVLPFWSPNSIWAFCLLLLFFLQTGYIEFPIWKASQLQIKTCMFKNLYKLHSISDSSLFLLHTFLVHMAWISHLEIKQILHSCGAALKLFRECFFKCPQCVQKEFLQVT